jgi:hypothetical protein
MLETMGDVVPVASDGAATWNLLKRGTDFCHTDYRKP